jgi:hypothetical protein
MRRALIPAFLLLLGSAVLGATVLREPIAKAASPIASVFVTNDASNPVPVREQNNDANGNIKVHEQGTANVNVTNSGLSVKPQLASPTNASFGYGLSSPGGHTETQMFGKTIDLTYIDVTMNNDDASLYEVSFYDGSSFAFGLPGPAYEAQQRDYRIALTQPVRADRIEFNCASACRFFALGSGSEVSP